MEDIVEVELSPDIAVEYPQQRLPEDLYQYNSSEIVVKIGEKDNILPGIFQYNTPVPKGRMNEVDQLLPVVSVWCLLHGCHC